MVHTTCLDAAKHCAGTSAFVAPCAGVSLWSGIPLRWLPSFVYCIVHLWIIPGIEMYSKAGRPRDAMFLYASLKERALAREEALTGGGVSSGEEENSISSDGGTSGDESSGISSGRGLTFGSARGGRLKGGNRHPLTSGVYHSLLGALAVAWRDRDALRVLGDMERDRLAGGLTVEAVSIVMRMLGEQKAVDNIVALVERVRRGGLRGDTTFYNTALHACREASRWDAARVIVTKMREDWAAMEKEAGGRASSSASKSLSKPGPRDRSSPLASSAYASQSEPTFGPSSNTFRQLAGIFSEAGEDAELATVLAESAAAGFRKDVAIHSAVITGHGRAGRYDKVAEHYWSMRREGVPADLRLGTILVQMLAQAMREDPKFDSYRDTGFSRFIADAVGGEGEGTGADEGAAKSQPESLAGSSGSGGVGSQSVLEGEVEGEERNRTGADMAPAAPAVDPAAAAAPAAGGDPTAAPAGAAPAVGGDPTAAPAAAPATAAPARPAATPSMAGLLLCLHDCNKGIAQLAAIAFDPASLPQELVTTGGHRERKGVVGGSEAEPAAGQGGAGEGGSETQAEEGEGEGEAGGEKDVQATAAGEVAGDRGAVGGNEGAALAVDGSTGSNPASDSDLLSDPLTPSPSSSSPSPSSPPLHVGDADISWSWFRHHLDRTLSSAPLPSDQRSLAHSLMSLYGQAGSLSAAVQCLRWMRRNGHIGNIFLRAPGRWELTLAGMGKPQSLVALAEWVRQLVVTVKGESGPGRKIPGRLPSQLAIEVGLGPREKKKTALWEVVVAELARLDLPFVADRASGGGEAEGERSGAPGAKWVGSIMQSIGAAAVGDEDGKRQSAVSSEGKALLKQEDGVLGEEERAGAAGGSSIPPPSPPSDTLSAVDAPPSPPQGSEQDEGSSPPSASSEHSRSGGPQGSIVGSDDGGARSGSMPPPTFGLVEVGAVPMKVCVCGCVWPSRKKKCEGEVGTGPGVAVEWTGDRWEVRGGEGVGGEGEPLVGCGKMLPTVKSMKG